MFFRMIRSLISSKVVTDSSEKRIADNQQKNKVLNVGGNSKKISIPDLYHNWQHDLLDIDKKVKPDILCDARKLNTLVGNCYESIYCSHNLEHYYEHEVPKVLSGFLHMLKDNGFVYITVPDIEWVARVMIENNLDIEDELYISRRGVITFKDVIYGWGENIGKSENDFFAHKTGFTKKSLTKALVESGFSSIFLCVDARFEFTAIAFKNALSIGDLNAFKSNPILHKGNNYLSAGDVSQAEHCYRYLVDLYPNSATAHFNLGFVLNQKEIFDESEACLRKAIEIDEYYSDAWHCLGLLKEAQGKPAEAIEHLKKALMIDPMLDMARCDLCKIYFNMGDKAEAKQILLEGIEANPLSAELHYYLANFYLDAYETHNDKSNIQKMLQHYELALNANPSLEMAHHQLYQSYISHPGLTAIKTILLNNALVYSDTVLAQYYAGCVHLNDGEPDRALDFFNKAAIIDTNNALVYFQIGNACQQKADYLLAADAYQKAIEINANILDAYKNLGFIFQQQNKYDEAIAIYKKAIEKSKDDAELFNNLGAAFHYKNEFLLAIDAYQKAIQLNPIAADIYCNLARTFNELLNFKQAIINYEKAFELGIKTQDLLNKIACSLRMQGKLDESIEKYRQALLIPADDATTNITLSNFLFTYTYCNYSPMEYLKEAKAYGARVLSKATPYQYWHTEVQADINRPLRIGFVSADLRAHPVGFFVHALLKKINTNHLQVIIYATGNKKEDALSQHIKAHALAWHDISDVSDEVAANQICNDHIDVLVDLSGHTGSNRLALFAWKPAPVQVTWLGYWATTGVPGIDYILADSLSVPIEDHPFFSEKVHYLPDIRMCLEPPHTKDGSVVSASPAQTNGFITFGSFQNTVKMNADVLAVWSKVLTAIPTARLRLQSQLFSDADVCEQILDKLMSVGVHPDRVLIKSPQHHQDYLASYSEVDIVLDTFPFPGGTTTCEALWMGVPTVTLAGNTMISRQGASMLTCAGLKEWVAHTKEEYMDIVISKASDINALAQLRAGLREQVRTTPLFDTDLFARHFENSMFEMWKEKIRTINYQG